MMQLRHIEACHAVFQTGAIARAARVLSVSQPAVSKLIKHVPTREAELLAPEIAKVFRQLNQLQRLSQNLLPQGQALIRIGCIPSLGLGREVVHPSFCSQ